MTVLDDEMLPLALALLEEFGKPVTHQRVSASAYDAASLDVASAAPVTSSVKVYRDSPTVEDHGSGLVEQGDEILLLAGLALPYDPVRGDTFAFAGGDTLTVKKLMPVWSGEKVALWRLAVAR